MRRNIGSKLKLGPAAEPHRTELGDLPDSFGQELFGDRRRRDQTRDTDHEARLSQERAQIDRLNNEYAAQFAFNGVVRSLALARSLATGGRLDDLMVNLDTREGVPMRGLVREGEAGFTAQESLRSMTPLILQQVLRGVDANALVQILGQLGVLEQILEIVQTTPAKK